MALTAKLEFRQSQQLVMTPQLQQAIKLLQLSNMELVEYVETELERNPLLERDTSGDGPIARDDPRAEVDVSPAAAEVTDWLEIGKATADPAATFDTEVENVFPDTSASDLGPDLTGGSWAGLRTRGPNASDDDVNLEAFLSSETSLKDHLAAQLPHVLTSPAERLIGHYLIDTVDDAGYLGADLADVAEKLAAPRELVDRVLATLQTLEPAGILARTLSECLALQLKEQNRYDPQIARLLDNLPLLAAHDLTRLKKAVGVDMDELAEMIAEIKELNPKPGLQFGSVQVQSVVPDVLVRLASDGSFIVELNSDTLPRVLVNRTYFARVSKTAQNPGDRDYLSECLQTANWLAKSLDQRARTILKVAEEIVRQQDGFFTYGVEHLRPLNLKTVAEAISMHESTVSRVTSNKYMATPRGIFELKYFFTSSIASSEDGEAHSSEKVRHRIKQLIDGEKASCVLSDDRLVEMLRAEGIDIARWTVAKYREALRIPSSVQRRREKQMDERMERASA
ncbi:MAG: RNA polymerase factor sigma-54 [Hyphomicrobiaceae bacterium]|nr:RNA polymerase factor sigma-54 [Hyphomicrobiaceae bacterium]